MKSFDEWFVEKHGSSFDDMHMLPNYRSDSAMRALTVALREYVTDMVTATPPTKLGCLHVNLLTAGAGMICLECGAYLELTAE